MKNNIEYKGKWVGIKGEVSKEDEIRKMEEVERMKNKLSKEDREMKNIRKKSNTGMSVKSYKKLKNKKEFITSFVTKYYKNSYSLLKHGMLLVESIEKLVDSFISELYDEQIINVYIKMCIEEVVKDLPILFYNIDIQQPSIVIKNILERYDIPKSEIEKFHIVFLKLYNKGLMLPNINDLVSFINILNTEIYLNELEKLEIDYDKLQDFIEQKEIDCLNILLEKYISEAKDNIITQKKEIDLIEK